MKIFNWIMALVIAATVGWAFLDRIRYEKTLKMHRLKPGRKTYLVEPLMLPIYLAMLAVISMISGGVSYAGTAFLATSAVLFLYIGAYYAVLLLILPFLRRFISARACATLWLLPNLLYFTIYLDRWHSAPLFVITIPRPWVPALIIGWAAGFSCVLLWQIGSHLSYRYSLLQSAVPVAEEDILSEWSYQQRRHEVRRNIPVLRSQKVTTPVTIGCFELTMRLVLPMRNYNQDELSLIFRHELRHIQRCDARTKLFLGFCSAMCWFNPLMWVARRHVSADLELSCDEAVLQDSDQQERRQYAELLLQSAGDERGYTTCLSASAASLRYRLKNVVTPRKRFTGAVSIGFAMLILLVGSASIALAGSSGTVQELILDQAPQGIAVNRVSTYRWQAELRGYSSVYGWEENPLTEYMAALQVKQVYVGSYPQGEGRQLYVDYAETVAGEVASLTRLEIGDGLLRANIPYDEHGEFAYILESEVDWTYLDSLLDFDAANPDPAPHPPWMMLYFNEQINAEQLMHASRIILSINRDGVPQEVNEALNDLGIGGVYGFPVTQVQLSFSYPPAEGYRVKVENWDGTESYDLTSDQLIEDFLPLAPYSAHYTVNGSFATVRDTVYEMEFRFDVKLPE